MTPTKESLFAALSFTLEAVKNLDEKWWPYAAGLKLCEMFTDYQDFMDKESAKTKAETLKLIKAIARERTETDLDAAFDFASSIAERINEKLYPELKAAARKFAGMVDEAYIHEVQRMME